MTETGLKSVVISCPCGWATTAHPSRFVQSYKGHYAAKHSTQIIPTPAQCLAFVTSGRREAIDAMITARRPRPIANAE